MGNNHGRGYELCDYFDCDELQDPQCIGKQGMCFCKKHEDEINALVFAFVAGRSSPAEMVRRWVQSLGGPEEAARSMMQGEG